jgi:hypothetical protein
MPKARSKMEKALIGPAAEHYVLFRLHRQGFLATLAPRNAPTVDILVMNPDETVVALVQVKARTQGPDGGWHMNVKHERFDGKRLFFAFVDLEPESPTTYIVPAVTVAEVLKRSHAAWLVAPGVRGPHHDNPMRRIRPRYPQVVKGYADGWLERYLERWDLLVSTKKKVAGNTLSPPP